MLGISSPKGCSREALFSSSGSFSSGGGAPLPAQILGRSTPGQSPDELRFFLSHVLSQRTSSIRIGLKSAPTSSCDDVPFVSAIRSPVTGDVASRRTMRITTGSQSVAVTVGVAGKPSPFCRRFPSLTPTTACSLDVRPYGGALKNTAPGKRRHLRSKTRIACLIPPPSAVGPTAWTLCNRLAPFCVRPLPVPLIGWHAATHRVTKCCRT
jgi:hypothetical protein